MNIQVIERLDLILANGLVSGGGDQVTTFCAEEAVCLALGEPITSRPVCVDEAVSAFGRRLNDSRWSSNAARAKGMRAFMIAQLGTKGTIEPRQFAQQLVLRTIREVLPLWLRQVWIDKDLIAACEDATTVEEGRQAAARASYTIGASAAVAANAAARGAAFAAALAVAKSGSFASAANGAASVAANAAADDYTYDDVRAGALDLSARIAVEILRDLGSPGARFLDSATVPGVGFRRG